MGSFICVSSVTMCHPYVRTAVTDANLLSFFALRCDIALVHLTCDMQLLKMASQSVL